jgi:hypothetical protein
MELEIRNPNEGVYAATGDYVHALEVRAAERMLFVSGTMGLDAEGNAGATLDEHRRPHHSDEDDGPTQVGGLSGQTGVG